MAKLYIQPTHGNGQGYLATLVARLQYSGYPPVLVGWGYPPIYVNAPRDVHPFLMRLAYEVDPDTVFAYYRPDLEGMEGVRLNGQGEIESLKTASTLILPKPLLSWAA